MKIVINFSIALVFTFIAAIASGQEEKKSEAEFVAESPAIGDALPEVTVYAVDGKAVKTSELRGHYTVLTFGCLT